MGRELAFRGILLGEAIFDWQESLRLSGFWCLEMCGDGDMGNIYKIRRLRDGALLEIHLTHLELLCSSKDYTNLLLDRIEAAEAGLVGSF